MWTTGLLEGLWVAGVFVGESLEEGQFIPL